ncbi:MAG: non-ribosomal peptide synthetase, partial [Giesbergeria sp.]
MFTSGTTGAPKGIVNSHRSVCHLIDWYLDAGIYRAGDKIPQLVSYAFEAYVGELLPTLAAGATLYTLPPLNMLAPAAVLEIFRREQFTVATISPSYALQLFRPDAAAEALPALRCLLFGGEPLLPAQVAAVRSRLDDAVTLINAYGPTETTVHATCWTVPQLVQDIAVGRPLPGKRILVVDDAGFLCPPGVSGEIWIGGSGLASCYHADPARTSESFVQVEYAANRIDRFYRTGDLGTIGIDGVLRIAGRRDLQVKIHGQRVETGEVEMALGALPGVREAAALAHEYRPGQHRLVAFICGDELPDDMTLGRLLRERLPAYMIPARYERLDKLPTSHNSKVDRPALERRCSELEAASATHDESPLTSLYMSSMDQTLNALTTAWEKVLRRQRAEPDANFFTSGGDSILALELVSELAENGYSMTPKEIFTHPT